MPDLRRLALVLDALPDEALLAQLEERRGQGRDDYPVAWRATVAGIVFQHESVESPVRELDRNPALVELCGPLDYQDKPKVDDDGKPRTTSPAPRSTVPGSHNFSRFPSSLLESRDPWIDVRQLRERAELPDFGEHLGGKAVDSHSTGQISCKTGKTPDADWGKHETTGVDGNNLWTKVKSWFGYGLHMIAGSSRRPPSPPGCAAAVPPRIYSRVDNAYRMERHRGMLCLRLGLVTVVMMAMALGHLRAERQDRVRSLVGPVGLRDTG